MADLRITFDGDHMRFVYDDELAGLLELGEATVRRASHVEPVPGGWTADMRPMGGPVLGANGATAFVDVGQGVPYRNEALVPFRLRGEALAAEREWLKAHGF